jgi:hypothetical protein
VVFDQIPPPPNVMRELRDAPGVWLLRAGDVPYPPQAFETQVRDLTPPAFVPFVGFASHVKLEPTASQPSAP